MQGLHRCKWHFADIGISKGRIEVSNNKLQRRTTFGFQRKRDAHGGRLLNCERIDVVIDVAPSGHIGDNRPYLLRRQVRSRFKSIMPHGIDVLIGIIVNSLDDRDIFVNVAHA